MRHGVHSQKEVTLLFVLSDSPAAHLEFLLSSDLFLTQPMLWLDNNNNKKIKAIRHKLLPLPILPDSERCDPPTILQRKRSTYFSRGGRRAQGPASVLLKLQQCLPLLTWPQVPFLKTRLHNLVSVNYLKHAHFKASSNRITRLSQLTPKSFFDRLLLHKLKQGFNS